MDLRLIELMLPRESAARLESILRDHEKNIFWKESPGASELRTRILVSAEKTEAVADVLEKEFKGTEGFRILLLPLEASIPRLEPREGEKTGATVPGEASKQPRQPPRICREELYGDIAKTANLTWIFVILVVLSTLVASVGILRDSVVVVIGAMVIAPLLGPNVALALATTLGDQMLARKAMETNIVGILAALAFSALLGRFVTVDAAIPELLVRTKVSLGDIILALAAGGAAALSFTSGLLSALIGVMVAVALLPPLVTLGLLIGSGQWALARGALLLLLTNLICINLAGVVVFLAQGIRPLSWWEAEKAKKATLRAILAWAASLLVLGILIVLSSR